MRLQDIMDFDTYLNDTVFDVYDSIRMITDPSILMEIDLPNEKFPFVFGDDDLEFIVRNILTFLVFQCIADDKIKLAMVHTDQHFKLAFSSTGCRYTVKELDDLIFANKVGTCKTFQPINVSAVYDTVTLMGGLLCFAEDPTDNSVSIIVEIPESVFGMPDGTLVATLG
jgi:hypothetical protein